MTEMQWYGWVEGVIGIVKLFFVIAAALFMLVVGAPSKFRPPFWSKYTTLTARKTVPNVGGDSIPTILKLTAAVLNAGYGVDKRVASNQASAVL
jgi:hypothetical protein